MIQYNRIAKYGVFLLQLFMLYIQHIYIKERTQVPVCTHTQTQTQWYLR